MDVSSELLSAALDTPMGAVAVLDDEGDVLYANRAFEDFFEDGDSVERSELAGVPYVGLLREHGFDVERVEAELFSVIAGDTDVYRLECPLDDEWYLIKGSRFTFRDSAFVSTVVSEITERKEMESELRDTVERLQYVTRMLSHDLNNPLNVALGRIQLVETQDGELPDGLEQVRTALERMSRIVNETVTVAESDPTADHQQVDLAEAARESWETSPTADATLDVVDDVSFPADPQLLSHILDNLFRNAVVHGGESVTVRVGELPDGFYVEDDGAGFSAAVEEDLDQLFEQGFTTGTDGAGLGLAIVSYMVDLHGWAIDPVEGESGGARFEIRGTGATETTGSDGATTATD